MFSTFFVFFIKKKAQTKHSKFNTFHFVKTGYQVAKFVMFLPLTFCNVKRTFTKKQRAFFLLKCPKIN